VRSGAARATRARRRRRRDYVVFVLAYHEITRSVADEREGVVAASRLASHLECLQRDFRVVSLSQAAAALRSHEDLDEDLVAVTFDDGYRGNHDWALPMLREYGVPATVFVTTGFLDGTDLWFDLARRFFERCAADAGARVVLPRVAKAAGVETMPIECADALALLKRIEPARREAALAEMRTVAGDFGSGLAPLAWDHVRALADAGIEIGCHTITHPILSTLSPAEQRREIAGARDRIAERTGVRPALFAYPNGSELDFDDHTVEILKTEGFDAACTTSRGPNRRGADPYRLKRLSIGSDTPAVLTARLSGLFDDEVRAYLPASMRHVH